jgi:hypothetical protein
MYKTFDQVVDLTNPTWKEIENRFYHLNIIEIHVVEWPLCVKLFDKQLLTDFLTVCKIDVKSVEKEIVMDIIDHIERQIFYFIPQRFISHKNHIETIILLEQLVEIWGFELTNDEYIEKCVDHNFYTETNKINMVKFFLKHGSTFNLASINCAYFCDKRMLELMIDNGVNPDDIAVNLMRQMEKSNNCFVEKLRFLGEKTDIVGYLDEMLHRQE